MKRGHSSLIAWLDLYMNIACTAVALFVIAFIFMAVDNTKKTEEGILPKADFLITLDWSTKSNNDIDLWVRDPDNMVVGYRAPSVVGMFLDRDDLGNRHDIIVDKSGKQTTIEINQEVITIRGYKQGKYTVNAHYYRGSTVENLTVSVLKLQPFSYVFRSNETILDQEGQEKTLVSFEIDSEGKLISISTESDLFVNRRSR